MKAFIQKNQGEMVSVSVLAAALDFREKGYWIEYFELPSLATLPQDDDRIIIGAIRTIAVPKSQRV